MDRQAILMLLLFLVATMHGIHAIIFGGIAMTSKCIPQDRKIATYITLASLFTLGIIGWVLAEQLIWTVH
jgi:hypothetical protein